MRQLWKVFVVKVNSFPEVDFRPALLWPRSLELGLLQDIISTSLAYLAVIAHCFSFASEEMSDTGGVAGSPGVSTPRRQATN